MSKNQSRSYRKLFEKLYLSPVAWNIFWSIYNNTLDKKQTTVDMVSKQTGINKGSIYRAIRSMVERGILLFEFQKRKDGIITINQIVDDWLLKEPKKQKEKEHDTERGLPKTEKKTGVSDYKMTEGFQRFMSIYPQKMNVVEAAIAWNQLNPDEELIKVIIQSVKDHMQSDMWKDKKYIPYPERFIRGKRWLNKITKPKDWRDS